VKSILVTGGAGFIGANLVRRLIKSNYQVVIFDDFSTGDRGNLSGIDCEVHIASLLDTNALRKALKNVDYVFHLAALGSVPRSLQDPKRSVEVNVQGTLNLLEAIRDVGVGLTFTSSSSVYGANSILPKTEKSWVSPLSPYASSKLAGEALIQGYAQSFGLEATIFRLFNVYGPLQRPNHEYSAVIPRWIWQAISNNHIEVYGDGTQSRDFTFVHDVIDILFNGMTKQIDLMHPINLAFGEKISLNQVIDLLKNYFPLIKVNHLSGRKSDVYHSLNNPELIKQIFPEVIPTPFTDGFAATLEWIRSQGTLSQYESTS
jgi:UDP-glucose 4-epimerase